MNITEHVEGDECKFVIWTGGRTHVSDKLILRVSKSEAKKGILLWKRASRRMKDHYRRRSAIYYPRREIASPRFGWIRSSILILFPVFVGSHYRREAGLGEASAGDVPEHDLQPRVLLLQQFDVGRRQRRPTVRRRRQQLSHKELQFWKVAIQQVRFRA